MNVRLAVAASVVALSLTAWATQEEAAKSEGTWVGTITTQGNVTTVVNQSGSVWGGTARLVEEASIGVDVGEDPYMLGDISGIAAREGMLYVLDSAIPTIRVYDERGAHVRDIGREGEGPGEFGTGLRGPVGIAFDEDGRLYVHGRSKIEIFDGDGELLDTWNLDRGRARQSGVSLVVPQPGLVLLAERLRCEERIRSRCGMAMRRIEEGLLGDAAEPMPDLGYHTPDTATEVRRGQNISWLASTPPFVPALVWTVGPEGDVVVGRADRYEFERHHLDGAVSVASRYWDPVAVDPDEGRWYLRRERLRTTREGATYVGTYDLDEGLPDRKPAFREIVPTHDGGVWLVRAGPGERLTGCDETTADLSAMGRAPCWRDTTIVDAFDDEGRYLGVVDLPAIFDSRPFPVLMRNLDPFIRGTRVFAAIEDEAGTIMVKRYRLVLPGEE